MYGLPENFDTSFIQGQTLEMVSFNANQLYLHFSGHVMITVEATFLYQESASQPAKPVQVPVKESNLMQLVEHTVTKASGDKNGTLSLFFDNGQTFQCFDSSKNYESYQIKIGEKVVIV